MAVSRVTRLLGLLLLALAPQAHADTNLDDLYRDPRAQAMGNAFTAVADDGAALFYNPAGLAGITSSTAQIATVNAEVAGSTVTSIQSTISTMKNINSNSLEALMGKDLYVGASLAPVYSAPNFAIGIISDQQLAFVTRNQALPQITLGYQTTNGVAFGYGTTVNPSNKETEIRVGIGGDLLWRRGGYYDVPLTELVNISETTLKNMIGNFGMGVGVNLGTQIVEHVSDRFQLMTGMAYNQIGGVSFGDSGAAPLPGDLSVGVAARYKLTGAGVTVSADYRNINVSTDWRMRTHLGTELALPLISLYAGLSQMYFCYGASFDIWLAKITALSYVDETGDLLGQDPERRYIVQVSFGFGL